VDKTSTNSNELNNESIANLKIKNEEQMIEINTIDFKENDKPDDLYAIDTRD
jgi:hypothetical protein